MIFQMLLISVVLFLTLYSHVSSVAIAAICIILCGFMLFIHHGHKHEHGAFLSIDYRAHQSKISSWNTELKILLVIFCVFVCISASSVFVPLFLLAGMSLLIAIVGKTPLFYYLTLLSVPAVFILLSCLALLMEFSPTPFGVLSVPIGGYYLCVPEANQYLAARTMLRSMGAVSCLYMLSLSTPVYRIIAAFRMAKIPAIVIDLMYLIYRYLFILLGTHQNMVHAASSRLGYVNYRKSIATMLKNARNLMFISFRQTSDMLSAMESRCYDGEIKFLHKSMSISAAQILWSLILSVGVIFLWIFTKGAGF